MEKQFPHNFRSACVLFILLLPFLSGCDKKNISFGQNLAETYTNIIVIDTLTPLISTIRSDSFITSNTSTMVVGNYKDNVFGSINARSFFQLSIPPTTTVPADAIFDSLTLKLLLTKQYYGDTNIVQQINVNELTSKIEYYGENTGFFNTSSIPFSATPLGTKQFSPKPNRVDTLEIRLSDAKGQDFLQKMKDQATSITDQTYFLQYFKGLTISTSSTPSSIISYSATDTTLRMRLYYTERGIILTHKFVDLNMSNPELQFNQQTVDRSNTVLSTIPKNTEIVSSLLGHAAYVQSATGIYAKIRFPTLPNLLQIKQSGKILKAQLIIKPLAGSFNSNVYRLPPQLTLITTNKNNTFGPPLADPTATTTTQTGNLNIDNLYGENTSYTYDITSYLQSQLTVNPNLGNGFLLYPPSTGSSFDFSRLVVGDNTTGTSKIQVKIFFLAVD